MAKDKSKDEVENSIKETEPTDITAKDTGTEEPNTEVAEPATDTAKKTDTESKDDKPPKTAKAGKRSAKAIAEEEEKQAKEARKLSDEEQDEQKPKQHQNPTRTKLERRSKGYKKSAKAIDSSKAYTLNEALELAKKTNHVAFDASVELHVRLNVNPRQADQNIRDSVVLPAGSGKKITVAVFANAEDTAQAKKAGADIAEGEAFLTALEKGTINFDVLIATPEMMPKLGKYARVLGPKGLMPNPKSGTVTKDVARAVSEAKAGKIEYRVDETGIIHAAIGKVSFSAKQLQENAQVLLSSIKSNKPGSVKASYVKSIYVTTSMGPSIQVQNAEL